MALPILDTLDPELTVGQGQLFTLTATELNTHTADASDYNIVITALPTKGTLYHYAVPISRVPYNIKQADINGGFVVYENDGLHAIEADSFVFKLSDTILETSTTTFTITVNDANKGWLVSATSIESVSYIMRFSRLSIAQAYADAWAMSHLGTITTTKIASDVTTWDGFTLNHVNTDYTLTDADEYLDTAKVKTAATQVMAMLPNKATAITYLIRMYGHLLETTEADHITALTGTAKTDWDYVRSQGMTHAGNLFHNWMASLKLIRALLQVP